MSTKVSLTDRELIILEMHDGHNPCFNFPLFTSQLKEALEERTGLKYSLGEDCLFHLEGANGN